MLSESKEDISQESEVLAVLSEGLRENLMFEANKLVLVEYPVFK